MEWNYRDDLPIYSQLVDNLKKGIVSGELEPRSRLMSVRELALEAGVNPNTMQRALTELEGEGLIYTQRTVGRFVTEDKETLEKVRNNLAKETTQAYLKNMKELGFDIKEISRILKEES